MPRLPAKFLCQLRDILWGFGNPFRPRIPGTLGIAQGTCGIAQRTLAAIGNHVSYLRCAVTAIEVVDILNDFFAPARFNIYVNIRRALPVWGQEALKEQLRGNGLCISNA